MKNKLLPEIQNFVNKLELSKIPAERKELLQNLSRYIKKKMKTGGDVRLNFICTHNSRRSQLSQVWAQTAAFYYGINEVKAFSGGTETTAFHPNAIRTLEAIGFSIAKKEKESNPVYFILCSPDADPLPCFSKLYNDPINCLAPFAAVMTCSNAETNCPYIPEAEARFSVKYEDPKVADGTPQEEQTYAERNRQIATEMFYLFSLIHKENGFN